MQISFSMQSILLAVLAACCAAAGLLFVYLLAEGERSAVLPAGFAVVFMCYVSGCFVPSAILPKVVNRLAAALPTTYVKKAFTALFSGGKEDALKTAVLLCIFLVCFLLGALFVVRREERKRWKKERKIPEKTEDISAEAGHKHIYEGKEEAAIRVGQTKKNGLLFWILGKRLLYKKTIWVCLLCMIFLSALQYHLEKQSEAVITAAVYTPDTKLREIISEYDGLVHFLVCEDSEEVKRNVVRGNAECGYVLQEDLQEQIMAGNGIWSIEAYEKADSTMTRVVNEVLFERIFYVISAEWFEGYIAENAMFADARLEVGEDALRGEARRQLAYRLSDDSTFRFEHITVLGAAPLTDSAGTEGRQKSRTAYPAEAAAGAGIVLCGIAGVLEALQDIKKKRFRGRTALMAGVFTVLQPVLCGTLAALGIIGVTRGGAGLGRQTAVLFLLAAAVILVGIGVVLVKRVAERS